jgi:hypothetical protein
MTDQQAQDFTHEIFDKIQNAESIWDLEILEFNSAIPQKNRMNVDDYPKIGFRISPQEIQDLIESGMIDGELNFTNDISTKIIDPLTKVLYATAWKNGDLKKIKNIIKGVLDGENENLEQEKAIVFHQFGKYLTKSKGQPIIDQHVIRAYAVYRSTNLQEVQKWRKMDAINKKHKGIIEGYKEWLLSDNLNNELRKEVDYTYYIDKLLFATGKTIKKSKKNSD